MDKKTTSIVAYLTLIGTVVALLGGDKEGAKFHINQALVLFLASIIVSTVTRFIPLVGGIISLIASLFFLFCWIIGFIAAINQEEKEIPFLGQIKILN